MIEEEDYIIAENSRYLGEGSLSTALQGVFIGTQNYFFFIPVNTTEDIRKTKKRKPVEPTFFYKGKPVATALQEILSKKELTKSELEIFILKKVKKAIPETNCCALKDINQFKIYSKWWGSGILVNTTDGETGWKPLYSRFKGSKKKVKAFYQAHSKLVR